MDTQLPRFQVFVQEKPGAPHQDVGTVHAADAELALQNARDVFARRPESISMWVVPVGAILWITLEQLSQERSVGEEIASHSSQLIPQHHYVFCKVKQTGTHEFFTTVLAESPWIALKQVRQSTPGKQNALSWCIFPENSATKSDPNEVESLYVPALEKTFRMSTDFRTISAMRAIKSTSSDEIS